MSEAELPPMEKLRSELAALRHELEQTRSELARVQAERARLGYAQALLEASLDLSSDGILVASRDGRMLSVNRRFNELWRIPSELLGKPDERLILSHVISQLRDPQAFLARVEELYQQPDAESVDHIEFLDGRVFERLSRPFVQDGAVAGRVWCFRDVTGERQIEAANAALRDSEQRFQRMVASVPGMVYQFCLRPDGSAAYPFVSEGCREIYGLSPEEIMRDARLILDIVHPEDRQGIARSIAESAQSLMPWKWEGRVLRKDGQQRILQGVSRPVRMENGDVVWDGLLLDITLQRQLEQESVRSRLQQEVIAAQKAALTRLSTPLIPIAADVVVMPLIGNIDSERAELVQQALLDGVARARARLAILDITGVSQVDAQVARAVIASARAVQLLGAEVILTGVRAEVAQALIRLGVSLESIKTLATLQSAIAQALGRRP